MLFYIKGEVLQCSLGGNSQKGRVTAPGEEILLLTHAICQTPKEGELHMLFHSILTQLLLFSFSDDRTGGSERLHDLPKYTSQMGSDKISKPRSDGFQSPGSPPDTSHC